MGLGIWIHCFVRLCNKICPSPGSTLKLCYTTPLLFSVQRGKDQAEFVFERQEKENLGIQSRNFLAV